MWGMMHIFGLPEEFLSFSSSTDWGWFRKFTWIIFWSHLTAGDLQYRSDCPAKPVLKTICSETRGHFCLLAHLSVWKSDSQHTSFSILHSRSLTGTWPVIELDKVYTTLDLLSVWVSSDQAKLSLREYSQQGLLQSAFPISWNRRTVKPGLGMSPRELVTLHA